MLPEAEDVEVTIDPNDLRIDVYRSSGPGGQSVNTTDSAVRITHVPTGVVASCQNEKSQLQNREQAMRILRARLHAAAQQAADAEAAATRRSQVSTVDRSMRIRTYNYPENRISDHRTGFKAYNLDLVLDGDLDPVIESAVSADEEAQLDGRRPGVSADRDRLPLADALRTATARLAGAGVRSARVDAELLAGHLMGVGRGEVQAAALRGAQAPGGFEALVDERARRVPLQHLTGQAPFRGLSLAVGPGVFVPRPETEDVAGAAVEAARHLAAGGHQPLVVDLCTGSGAIAAAVATEVPQSVVHAVEVDPQAHAWAARNLAGTGAALHLADATTWPGPEGESFDGTVDVVVCNPPYIPDGMVPVDPEVADHDPEVALYGRSDDGLAVPRAVLARAAGLLRPGGVVVMEHAESQQDALLRVLGATGWQQAHGHRDLTGRPRWVTAVRPPAGGSSRGGGDLPPVGR